jgi:hypothetical protein
MGKNLNINQIKVRIIAGFYEIARLRSNSLFKLPLKLG